MNALRKLFSDRRRVLIGAAIIGAGFGAVALARRGSSAQAPADPAAAAAAGAPVPVYDAGTGGSYAFQDGGFIDSTSAESIVGQIQDLTANLESVKTDVGVIDTSVGTLTGQVADLTSLTNVATTNATTAIEKVQDLQTAKPAVTSPVSPVTPKPAAPKPATPAPKPSADSGNSVDHFQRSQAIQWKSLFRPVVNAKGQVTGKKAVELSKLTDAEILGLVKLDMNRGALAPGWTVSKSGQVVRG